MDKWAESKKESYLLFSVYYVQVITKSCNRNFVQK